MKTAARVILKLLEDAWREDDHVCIPMDDYEKIIEELNRL